eukprot:TRINITY_DN7371_c0_g1_i1.p1 TRINITY_DN7371_c0_g1~~TRINITY_DN7371_c0_g1_i1.p1  ORF type:complete len:201 (+),score=4.23 TRINITY_DN7371_c0_g1_i1:386-988(+)
MAPYLGQHINTDLFIMNSNVDYWHLQNIMQVGCVPSACNNTQMTLVNGYRDTFYAQLQPLLKRSNMKAYIDTCIVHEQNLRYCNQGNLHDWNCVGWTEHRVATRSPQQAFLHAYMQPEQAFNLLDTHEYPYNPSCVFSPNQPQPQHVNVIYPISRLPVANGRSKPATEVQVLISAICTLSFSSPIQPPGSPVQRCLCTTH